MDRRLLERNIKLYQAFEACREPIFWGPIVILFLNKVAKMTLPEIFFMESVVVAALIFLEIPTGALADLLGQEENYLHRFTLLSLGCNFFAAATCPLMAWIGNFLWVIGFSLVSGADSSMLYDTLKALGRENEYKKIQGRAVGYRMAIMAITSLAGGFLAEISLRLPAILGLSTLIVNCFVTAAFVEPPSNERSDRYCWRAHLKVAKDSFKGVLRNRKVKWLILFSATLAVASKLWFFTYNPYFELVKLPLPMFGVIFFCLNVVAAASSFMANGIYKKMGDVGSIVSMVALIGLPMVVMGMWPILPFAFLVLFQNFARGYLKPFVEHLLHDCIESKTRATVISIQSSVTSIGQAIGLAATGWYLAKFSLPSFLMVLGIAALILGLALVSAFNRTFKTD
jgi:hypothetical protein